MRKKIVLGVLGGFLLGVTWFVALRFVTFQDDRVHYHANFALYINGKKDEFKSFTFYEEVQSCGSDEVNNPKTRVHLHDNISHVVHVHDAGATWGHLFANLGYGLTGESVETDNGVLINGQDDNKLTFTLNGQEVDGVANMTIKTEDTLLINYGKDDETTLDQRYDAIVRDAGEYNKRNDPSACTGTKPYTFTDRLKQAIGL